MIIAAGTGYLGTVLSEHFKKRGYQITILSRSARASTNNVQYIQWDAKTVGTWKTCLENTDVLINLTGKSVDCRYNEKNKNEIHQSRVRSTQVLNEAILQCIHPPKHWLNSSTATIYEHSESVPMTESTGTIGNDFSMNVAKDWEKAFFETETPNTLKTSLRTSIVIGKKSAAFNTLLRLTKFRLGGAQGKGNQMVSWIHDRDFARAIEFIIDNEITNEINVCHPKPITNTMFMKIMRDHANVKYGLNSPKWIIKLGAFVLGTEAELVLKSRFVYPERLLDKGLKFLFSTMDEAIKEIHKPEEL